MSKKLGLPTPQFIPKLKKPWDELRSRIKGSKGCSVEKVETISTKISRMQVNLASGKDAAWSLQRMAQLSQELE